MFRNKPVTHIQGPTESRRSPSQPSVSAGEGAEVERTDEASPSEPQEQLFDAHIRRLQANVEAQSQQVKEAIQPLQDTKKSLVKRLESFLNQQDEAELRRKELEHKCWSERVWSPLQKRVGELVTKRYPVEAKRRQSLYSDYLQHCNSKGFVFLESYDPREYDPFLFRAKKPHNFKCDAADSKGRLCRQLQRTRSPEAGGKYKLAPVNSLLSDSASSSGGQKTGREKLQRLDSIPYHITTTATPDGRCHRPDCTFTDQEQPATLRQSLPTST